MEVNFDESNDDNGTTAPVEKLLPSRLKNASVSESKTTKTTKNNARGSKKCKKLPTQKEEQGNEFLKVATKSLQKEETEADLSANFIKRKVENVIKQLGIMCDTELHQVLLKYKM